MDNTQQKNQHLMWRAGFGPAAAQIPDLSRHRPEKLFHALLKEAEKKPLPFDEASDSLKSLVFGNPAMQPQSLTGGKLNPLSSAEKQLIRKQSVLDIAKLNLRWLNEMTTSSSQLLEKMALFWHGHFAAKTVNIFYDQALLNIIRENALGNFRDLLFSVSKSASMIQFLNNNQNRKTHPNENFARELMELFTIGRGHYTETDVKESARAFTGWGTNLQGAFDFRDRQHDDGPKTFLGKSGNFSGEEILDILLAQKQTAIFIAGKLYRFFVQDEPNAEVVTDLGLKFYDSNYDIRTLLANIFTSDWFYDPKIMGSQIKSPVLWLVGLRRQLPMEIQNPAVQLVVERLLGQVLFAPPNVAGWPGGKHWIDSSSLMLRMRLPQVIFQSDTILSKPKDDDDVMMGMKEGFTRNTPHAAGAQFFQAKIQWDEYYKNFEGLAGGALYERISGVLLQKKLILNEGVIHQYVDASSLHAQIQSTTIRLMGTPEYQLC